MFHSCGEKTSQGKKVLFSQLYCLMIDGFLRYIYSKISAQSYTSKPFRSFPFKVLSREHYT